MLISFLLFLAVYPIYAQRLIAVQNGGNPSFFTIMDSAIAHASPGDTIFLPGGSFPTTNPLVIDKELHIVGVGHDPDSTSVTNYTSFSYDLTIVSGADNGSLTGVKLGSFNFGTDSSNQTVQNYTIRHCMISNTISFGWFNATKNRSSDILVRNCVVGGISGGYSSGNAFLNNIIEGTVSRFGATNVFFNNVFLRDSGVPPNTRPLSDIFNCEFANNIFRSSIAIKNTPVTHCVYNNNLLVISNQSTLFSVNSSSLGLNNIFGVSQSSIFVNQSGMAFNYDHDYDLQTASLGKNAGTDGSDVGIYGGIYPWKIGSIPFNPHFQFKNVGPTTDNTGQLNVNIRVSAQNNE